MHKASHKNHTSAVMKHIKSNYSFDELITLSMASDIPFKPCSSFFRLFASTNAKNGDFWPLCGKTMGISRLQSLEIIYLNVPILQRRMMEKTMEKMMEKNAA